MRTLSFVLCLACAAVARAAENGATLRGRVALPKAPSAKSGFYAGRTAKPVSPPEAPIAAVLLEGGPASVSTNPPPVVDLVQEGYQFRPGLVVVRKGGSVRFPNHDSEYHNVLSYSRAKEFDLGRFVGDGEAPSVLFDKTGVIEVNCEIHPHMRAFVLVVDTPWFTTTDAEGRFELKGIPPGEYRLKAWSLGKTIKEKKITLAPGAELDLDLP